MKYLILLIIFLTACAPGTRYTLHEDNDYFKPTKNNDRDFSQGVRVEAETPDATGSKSYFIGNNFYTPGQKQLTTYQPEDRPYSGFTYIGSDFKYRKSPTVQDVFGVTLGVVGPHSYSEQIQNEVHRWLSQRTAKGWDNQIKDEIGVILKAERDYGYPLSEDVDMVSALGIHLGNVFTQVYGGTNFRYGYNLPDYFAGAEPMFPRLPSDDAFPSKWRAYVFGGPHVKAVYQNIFLDGNTFRDSPSIDKYPVVLEGRLGFAVEYGLYRLAYTYIAQTKEYHGSKNSNDFGEVNLSVGF